MSEGVVHQRVYGWGCKTEAVRTDCGRETTVSAVFKFEGQFGEIRVTLFPITFLIS